MTWLKRIASRSVLKGNLGTNLKTSIQKLRSYRTASCALDSAGCIIIRNDDSSRPVNVLIEKSAWLNTLLTYYLRLPGSTFEVWRYKLRHAASIFGTWSSKKARKFADGLFSSANQTFRDSSRLICCILSDKNANARCYNWASWLNFLSAITIS